MVRQAWAAAAAAGLALLTLVTLAGSANAYQFGKEEEIHRLVDVDITSQDNKALYLGYKVTTMFLGLGAYVSDDGYVFGARDDEETYYPTSRDELKKFQDEGLLPTPLPPYALSVWDYLIGYSLWITLAVIAVVYLVGWLRRRRSQPPPVPVAPA